MYGWGWHVEDVVIDLETNSLTPDTIWCMGAGNQLLRGKKDITEFLRGHEGNIYGHNSIGFDFNVLSDLYDFNIDPCVGRDTLVLSRLASPSRSGGHSLDSWGTTLGYPKGDHSDWSQYTDSMGEYCLRDVKLTEAVKAALDVELSDFSERSIDLEHKVAYIIAEQTRNGWKLDQEKCFMLLAELKEKKMELEEEVHRTFRPRVVPVKHITPKIKKDGSVSSVGLKYLGENCLDICGGEHTRVDIVDFNLGSRKQIGEYLMRLGWKPTKLTPTTPKGGGGNVIVSEEVLKDVQDIPEAMLIADYLTVTRRIAMAQSWLSFVGPDGRVHGEVNSNGAVTGRMTHMNPNVAQTTAGTKIYGSEMRACWVAEQGYSIVGMDASGLELRMLAHYMNDEEYLYEVVNGDVHTKNQRAAGLLTRDQAKTFIYAFLYGAGDAKIGSIIGGDAGAGRKLKAKFLHNTPALQALRDRVAQACKRGWLRGLDGRRIAVRSPHAALNTLLQGAGAVVMKQALINLHRFATAQQLDFKLVGNIHDEIQAEVLDTHAERYGKLAAYAMMKAGEDFDLRCPLAGKYKIGPSWKETH
jgi:DNA polymerase-1